MKNRFFAIIFVLVSSLSFGQVTPYIQAIPLSDTSVRDKSLSKKEAVFKFIFENINDANTNREIHYSIDDQAAIVKMEENSFIELTTTPGEHRFQFYYSEDYFEINTGSLSIKAQHRDQYTINFREAIMTIQPAKPVIYLYPKTEIDVKVQLDIKGTSTFMYPTYSDSWKFTAFPNGDLHFGERHYNYLFWESEQQIRNPLHEKQSGFIVHREEAVNFLEGKLSEAGLSSKEQADFITYWGPQLQKSEYNFVRFEFNEECNQYAEMSITPQPDNIYRVYMIWHPVDEKYKVFEQKITPAVREGFTVIEWGGYEIEISVTEQIKSL